MNDSLYVWVIAGAVALLTPLLGYFSPFGRARRSMVADLRSEIEDLRKKLNDLSVEIKVVQRLAEECEMARGRLERENYRLYRQLDTKSP